LAYSDIETPAIPSILHSDIIRLTEASQYALTNLIKANRAFFNNNNLIHDFIQKVHFYEHEADNLEEKLKRTIFQSGSIDSLAEKLQLRDIVH